MRLGQPPQFFALGRLHGLSHVAIALHPKELPGRLPTHDQHPLPDPPFHLVRRRTVGGRLLHKARQIGAHRAEVIDVVKRRHFCDHHHSASLPGETWWCLSNVYPKEALFVTVSLTQLPTTSPITTPRNVGHALAITHLMTALNLEL